MPFSSTHEDNVSQKNKGQDGETFLIQRLLGFTQNRAIEVCGPLRNGMARLLSWFQNGDLHSQVQDWCFKKQFRVLPFGISKLTEKLVFMYSSLMTELKKEIARFFQNKILVCIQKCTQHLWKERKQIHPTLNDPGFVLLSPISKTFFFLFITDKDYGYLLS